MKRLICFSLLLLLHSLPSIGQKIDYTIPRGYEDKIDKALYKKMVDLSVTIVSKKYNIEEVTDGTIILKESQEIDALNLHNLILKYSLLRDKTQWENEVKGHFENMFMAMEAQKKIETKNYSSLENFLTIRIYPLEYVMTRGDTSGLLTKQDLEGAVSILMIDLPGGFAPVQKTDFNSWGRSRDQVFVKAQQNINKQTVEKSWDTVAIGMSQIEYFIIEDDNYGGGYALDLDHNSPEMVGEWGTAIAIPHRAIALGCKISKNKPVDFVNFIQLTQAVVEKQYTQHPQPISTRFYWYYKGKFTPILVESGTGGNLNVISPMGLTELMTK